ncbi:aldo/keto reductase family protein [Humitalea rosea]|uniref:Aldo/keto reductase family protein n=1 Tax=Humitalea rosea TaxID=990373 RepID=A0A2W7JEH6_9PROT|nr:aldo/keto reductase [Humitalea rosea]PZW50867.1 aldo/keto reductase family protein [Humitalea rosea]
MKYTNLGASGLTVSRVCLGGNSWGSAGRRAWSAFDAEGSAPFFKRALDHGINFFDTADVVCLMLLLRSGAPDTSKITDARKVMIDDGKNG